MRGHRPAWLGIVGWAMVLAALILGVTAPWPHNGLTLAAIVLAIGGAWLVAEQITRTSRKDQHR